MNIVGNPFLYKPYNPLLVDEVGDPATTELTTQATIRIADEWVADAVLFTELPVGIQTVAADAQNLGIELFETGEVPLKSLQFAASDRGKIGVVEGEHQVSFTEQFTEPDLPLC